MNIRLGRGWAWLSVIIPAAIGIFQLLRPETALTLTPVHQLTEMMGIRQLVYSVMLLAALALFPNRVVSLLMVGRGLTDFADSIVAIAETGGFGAPAAVPMITALITFAAAYVLYDNAPSVPKALTSS
jgi:hypothetical protein